MQGRSKRGRRGCDTPGKHCVSKTRRFLTMKGYLIDQFAHLSANLSWTPPRIQHLATTLVYGFLLALHD